MFKTVVIWRVVATSISSIVCHALAQDIGLDVGCSSQYDWMTNSRSQSPCVVSSYLWSACTNNPTGAYIANMPCQCSTVFDAIYSACKICQGDQADEPWRAWKAVCLTFYPSVWPNDIPSETSIPAWAFLDAVYPHAFNVSDAQAIAAQGRPDSPAPFPSSATRPFAPRSGSGSDSQKISIISTVFAVLVAVVTAALVLKYLRQYCSDDPEIPANNAAAAPTVPPHTRVEVQSPSEGLLFHEDHVPCALVAFNDTVHLPYYPPPVAEPVLSPCTSPPPVASPAFPLRAPPPVAVPA